MIFRFISVLFFLLLLYTGRSLAQCSDPRPPVLTSVSVIPETGQIVVKWDPSPDTDIAAYIIYWQPDEGAGWMPVETIWDPSARSYTFSTTATKYYSMPFVAAAYRLPSGGGTEGCRSVLSNSLSTMFCEAAADTCRSRLSITWNKYSDFPEKVTEYRILVSEDGGPLVSKYSVSRDSSGFKLRDFTSGTRYCFAVRAVMENGLTCESNLSGCLLVRMKRPPSWINADHADMNDENMIGLSFTADPEAEIRIFQLERRTGYAGAFSVIAEPAPTAGKIIYNDDSAEPGKIYSYRLSALNGCNFPVTVSNIASNIILSADQANDQINLSWNRYREWRGDPSYELLMNTGNGFQSAASSLTDTVYAVNVRDIMYSVTSGEVCFRIEAHETNNPFGINGLSRSSQACSAATEVITVPDLFTPNNDSRNDFFRPVLSFTPVEYYLVITDMTGRVVFETKDCLREWDGSAGGNTNRQGVFLWMLKLTSPSGRKITRTGTVTIVR